MSKDEMKKLNFIRELPYDELIEAHKVIERGGTVALLYFWYNLHKCHYKVLPVEMVEKQTVWYTNLFPEWEGEIINWFNSYLDKMKAYDANYNAKRTA